MHRAARVRAALDSVEGNSANYFLWVSVFSFLPFLFSFGGPTFFLFCKRHRACGSIRYARLFGITADPRRDPAGTPDAGIPGRAAEFDVRQPDQVVLSGSDSDSLHCCCEPPATERKSRQMCNLGICGVRAHAACTYALRTSRSSAAACESGKCFARSSSSWLSRFRTQEK